MGFYRFFVLTVQSTLPKAYLQGYRQVLPDAFIADVKNCRFIYVRALQIMVLPDKGRNLLISQYLQPLCTDFGMFWKCAGNVVQQSRTHDFLPIQRQWQIVSNLHSLFCHCSAVSDDPLPRCCR